MNELHPPTYLYKNNLTRKMEGAADAVFARRIVKELREGMETKRPGISSKG